MSQVRLNFLGWQPDQDEYSPEGLIRANNVLHDTEGYKPLKMHTAGAFSASVWYTGATLASVRSMQIRAVGAGNNRVAAIVSDSATTAAIADLSIGVEGEAAAFTTVATATLASAGGVRCKAFSVGELESGVFLICAAFDASLQSGGTTLISLTGEVTYTIGSESGGDPGTGTTSLEGTTANHSRTTYNATATAGIYLKNDGVEYAVAADGTQEGSTLTSWLDTATPSDIWTYATVTSGSIDVDSGSGSWINNSTSLEWSKKQSSNGTGTAVVALSTSTDSSGTTVLETVNYTLTAIRGGTSLAGTQPEHSRTAFKNCWAGVYLKSDGVEYAYSSGGTPEGDSLGNWMDTGSSSDYWVQRTVTSGTLNDDDAGTGWLQLSTSRGFSFKNTSDPSLETCSITVKIATDSGGANIIDTKTYNLEVFAT